MNKSRSANLWSALGWIVGLGMFFPVFWMVLTSFKHERDAFTETPKLIFKPTFEQYKAVFDGRDDSGKALKPGKYTLYIEAAREHGTYQLIRHPLTLGKDPIGMDVPLPHKPSNPQA